MATPTVKPINLKMESSSPDHSRTDVLVRDVEFVMDHSVERGGSNLGPTPTETLISSLLGCTNSISHKIAKKHGIDFHNMAINCEYVFDRAGAVLEQDIKLPFPEIKMAITVETEASQEDLDLISAELTKYCPVAKVFREAGITIIEEWNVKKPG